MSESAINMVYPAGSFDKTLMVVDGNKQIFDLMGEYVYFPLYKMVREKDIQRLEAALEECSEEESIDELVCLINAAGVYEKFILCIRRCVNEEKYYIVFKNVSISERRLETINERLSFLRDFLTLSGQFLFIYRPEDNRFYMFWMNYEQEIAVYDGDADEWADKMVREKLVAGQDKEIFDAFCQAMRGADRSQSFTFRGSILTKGGNKDTYRIKFLPRSYGDEKLVLGLWTIINEQTGNGIDDYVEGTYMDSLTKILNKSSITEYAETALASGEKVALIMMDIDNFKDINDTYGHLFGDQVIAAAADIIKKVIGESGAAGRIGGDEFMIVLKDFEDELDLRNYLRGIKTNVAALFQGRLGGNRLSCSIGAAQSGIDSDDYKNLFRIADKALYIAKQKGKNRFIIYKKELHGQFNMSDDDYDMVEIRDSFYSEKDLHTFNKLLAETVLHGSSVLPQLLEHAVHTLMVDRLVVIWGEKRSVIAAYPLEYNWTENENRPEIFEEGPYGEMFRDDMLTITNTNMLEFSIPEVYAVFRKNNVLSVMQHLLRDADGSCKGMVIAEECVNLKHFPQIAVQLFENMCHIINVVLIKENLDN